MALTWPSAPTPASDIDFRTNFNKTTLIPIKKDAWSSVRTMLDHLGAKLGHLDHLQPQISISKKCCELRMLILIRKLCKFGMYVASPLTEFFLLTFVKKCFSWTLKPIYQPAENPKI